MLQTFFDWFFNLSFFIIVQLNSFFFLFFSENQESSSSSVSRGRKGEYKNLVFYVSLLYVRFLLCPLFGPFFTFSTPPCTGVLHHMFYSYYILFYSHFWFWKFLLFSMELRSIENSLKFKHNKRKIVNKMIWYFRHFIILFTCSKPRRKNKR